MVQEKKMRRMAGPKIVSPIRAVHQLRKQRGFLISELMLSMELYNSVRTEPVPYRTVEYVIKKESSVHRFSQTYMSTLSNSEKPAKMYSCTFVSDSTSSDGSPCEIEITICAQHGT